MPPPTEDTLAAIKRLATVYELKLQAHLEEYKKYSLAITNTSMPKNEVDLYFSLMAIIKSLNE
jgi:hypothetical protein